MPPSESRGNEQPTLEPRGDTARAWWIPPLAGAAFGVALRVVYSGDGDQAFNVMLGSFAILAPVAVGAVTILIAEIYARRSWGYYFGVAALANMLFILGTLVILIEGLICAIIAMPLFGLVGGIAGLATGAVCRFTRWARTAVYSVAVLPLVLGGFEHRIPLPVTVDDVATTRVVAAAPEQIWPHLLDTPNIEPREIGGAWMYRIGVPLPLTATTERRGDELVRHIAMGKGVRFDQIATDWENGRRVKWTYRFAPDSFPPGALDDHVRIGGYYFDVLDTEYGIEPTDEGARMTATMRYRVSTHFNWYARPVARFLVGNFQQTALEFYARRAEQGAR